MEIKDTLNLPETNFDSIPHAYISRCGSSSPFSISWTAIRSVLLFVRPKKDVNESTGMRNPAEYLSLRKTPLIFFSLEPLSSLIVFTIPIAPSALRPVLSASPPIARPSLPRSEINPLATSSLKNPLTLTLNSLTTRERM